METQETASVVTPYAEQESYETGRFFARIDRRWNYYDPPRNGNAAMLAGYDQEWSIQDMMLASLDAPATEDEARWELDLEYMDAMSE